MASITHHHDFILCASSSFFGVLGLCVDANRLSVRSSFTHVRGRGTVSNKYLLGWEEYIAVL